MWIPDGWWHETCNLDDFSSGIGGVTYAGLGRQPRRAQGKCNLGTDEQLNTMLSEFAGGEYHRDELPYCVAGNACPALPQV